MTDEQENELELLNDNITKAARIAALGKSEDERVAASQLYDELFEKRIRLQTALKKPEPIKTDIALDPYARIGYLEEKMAEAASSGDMALYSTMRNERKELVRQHGRKAPVVTCVTAEEITGHRRQQAEQNYIHRQKFEDENANPPERLFAEEGDIEKQMTAAAERGDHHEYGRLRRVRQAQKLA